jgi:hypothetical protein
VGYLAVTLVVAALVVLVTLGSFEQLAKVEVKAVWLLLAGLGIQIVIMFAGIPKHLYDSVGFGVIMFSYVLILAFCFVNIGIRGIGVITIGVAMNALVIGLNQGMPTSDQTITTASGREVKKPIEPDVKHRAERSSDLLPFLSDIIWLPAPFSDETLSFGDLIIAVGICEFAYFASRRRYTRGAGRTAEASTDGEPEDVSVGDELDADAAGTDDMAEPRADDQSEVEPEVTPELTEVQPAPSGARTALTPTLDQRMGMSAPRRSRTRSSAPSTRPS